MTTLSPRVAELIELLQANAATIAAQPSYRIEADCAGGNIRLRVYPAPPPVVDMKRSTLRRIS